MRLPLFFYILALILLLQVYPALAGGLHLEEALTLPPEIPKEAARYALICRTWFHAIQKQSEQLDDRRRLLFQLSKTDLPALTALLYGANITVRTDESSHSLTVDVQLSRDSEAETLTKLCLRNPELIWSSRHCLDEIHRILRYFDSHWPRSRFFVDLNDPSPQREIQNIEWTPEVWHQMAMQLKSFLNAHLALTPSEDGWFTQAKFLKSLTEAHDNTSSDPLILLLLSEAELRSNEPHLSIQHATEALKVHPRSVRARYIRALAHWQIHQLGLAENDLSMALLELKDAEGTRDDRLSVLRARGAVRMLLGQYAEMCQDFAVACSLGDCDGLRHARKMDQCLGHEDAVHVAEKENESFVPEKKEESPFENRPYEEKKNEEPKKVGSIKEEKSLVTEKKDEISIENEQKKENIEKKFSERTNKKETKLLTDTKIESSKENNTNIPSSHKSNKKNEKDHLLSEETRGKKSVSPESVLAHAKWAKRRANPVKTLPKENPKEPQYYRMRRKHLQRLRAERLENAAFALPSSPENTEDKRDAQAQLSQAQELFHIKRQRRLHPQANLLPPEETSLFPDPRQKERLRRRAMAIEARERAQASPLSQSQKQ